MSGHIKKLETLELVKRDAPDPEDRRLAQLPPEGQLPCTMHCLPE